MTNDVNADHLMDLIQKHNRFKYTWSDGLYIGERIRRAFLSEQRGGPAVFSEFLTRTWPVRDGPASGDCRSEAVVGVHPQLLISVRRVVAACRAQALSAQGPGTNRGADGDGTDG